MSAGNGESTRVDCMQCLYAAIVVGDLETYIYIYIYCNVCMYACMYYAMNRMLVHSVVFNGNLKK